MLSIRTTLGAISIILTDALICIGTLYIAIRCLADSSGCQSLGSLYICGVFALLSLIIILSLAFGRLYTLTEAIHPVDLAKRITPAFFLSLVSMATLGFFAKDSILLTWQLIPSLLLVFLLLYFSRYFLFFMLSKNRQRILLLGATPLAREIIEECSSKRFRSYEIAGALTSSGSPAGAEFHGVPILGTIDQVEQIIREHPVNEIVVAIRERRGKLPVKELLNCKVKNIRVQEGWSFYETVRRKLPIDEFLAPSWFIFEEGFYRSSLHGSIKRWQGIAASVLLLVASSPTLLLVAALIKLDSPGPVLFRQKRVGLNGKVFHLLKFRSMLDNAESVSGPVFTQEGDPRITRVGRIIRKLRLDELPQLINILKGDMDLVGPRPERPVFVRELEDAIPYYNLRHTVRPGLTGWAQVNYTYSDSTNAAKEKLRYDLYYVKHLSWYLDLVIIFLTIKEVLCGRGR